MSSNFDKLASKKSARNALNYKYKKNHTSSRNSFGCLIFTLFNLISFMIVNTYLTDHLNLPLPASESIESSLFSEERALIHLQKLASFGIRTVGSFSNEIIAPNYILDYIEEIASSSNNHNKIEIDIQKVSGTFILDNFLGGFVNTYSNITNILIRISNANKPETLNNAILISAHYDTAMACSGISDDAINIAIMMELVNNLLSSSKQLNFAIILNFNGGEETILQAAHGFITKHKWSDSIKLFINLEAAGAGGSELLFQTSLNNGWLVDAYKRAVKYPYAQSIGNVIFSSGIIPSLTDFTVYTDYGDRLVPGLDFAFTDNGYVYHTTKDNVDELDIGSLQHCGHNVLSLIHRLNEDLDDDTSYFYKYLYESDDKEMNIIDSIYMYDDYVFFDFFGMIMIAYPYTIGRIGHFIFCVLFFYIIRNKYKTKRTEIVSFMKRIVVANIGGIISSIVVGVFSFMFTCLSWYSYPKIAILIFGLPCMIMIILIHHHLFSNDDIKLSPFQLEETVIIASASWWYIIMIFITIFIVGASPMILFTCIAFLFILILRFVLFNRLSYSKYYYIYDIFHCLLLMVSMMVNHLLYLKVLNIFIPIMGRAGTEVPADIVISIIISTYICMLLSGGIHFIYRLQENNRILLAIVLSIILIFSVAINSLHDIYQIKTPKRLIVQSVARNWYNGSKDAGIWMIPFDSVLMEPLKNIGIDIFDKNEYQIFNHYQQPWYLPLDEMLRKSMFIDVEYQDIMQLIPNLYRTRIKIINQTKKEDGILIYFHVDGPSHFTMRMDTTMIVEWSFEVPVFHNHDNHFNGRNNIFMFIANGYTKMIRVKDEQFDLNKMLNINHEKPVKSEMVFWLKINQNLKENQFMFLLNGHHINGEYARNINRQHPVVKNDIISNLPNWVDALWFLSELIEVRV